MGSGLTVAAQPYAASLRSSAATGVCGCSLSRRGFRQIMDTGLTVSAQPDAASLCSSAATGVCGCSFESTGFQANHGLRFDGRCATGRSLASLVSGYAVLCLSGRRPLRESTTLAGEKPDNGRHYLSGNSGNPAWKSRSTFSTTSDLKPSSMTSPWLPISPSATRAMVRLLVRSITFWRRRRCARPTL